MKQCRKCGSQLSDDSVFCQLCGTKYEDVFSDMNYQQGYINHGDMAHQQQAAYVDYNEYQQPGMYPDDYGYQQPGPAVDNIDRIL